jgi:hypothetical protein
MNVNRTIHLSVSRKLQFNGTVDGLESYSIIIPPTTMTYVLGSSTEQVLPKMDKLAIHSLECELRKMENPDYSSG